MRGKRCELDVEPERGVHRVTRAPRVHAGCDPQILHALLDKLADNVADYVRYQVGRGVGGVRLEKRLWRTGRSHTCRITKSARARQLGMASSRAAAPSPPPCWRSAWRQVTIA